MSQVRVIYHIVLSFHLQVTSATSTIAFHWLEPGIFVASSYNSVDDPNIFSVNLSLLSVLLQTYAAILGWWIVFLCLIRILGQVILLSHCPYVHRPTHTQERPILVYSFLPGLGFEAANPVFELSKTIHTLDHASTVISKSVILVPLLRYCYVIAFV
jgi:hypothetical protein